MRTLLVVLSLLIPLTFLAGCTERRPDPRANPDFDEAALDPSRVREKMVDTSPN